MISSLPIDLTADLIELATMLGVVVIFALILRKQVRPAWLLASLGAIVAGIAAVHRGFGLIPEPAIFDALRYPWFNFALLAAVSFAIILATPQGRLRSGLTFRQRGPGVVPALLVSLVVCGILTYTAVADVFGTREATVEWISFNLLAIGPVEELFFRGVVFALVLEAFGARRVFLGAEVNWGGSPRDAQGPARRVFLGAEVNWGIVPAALVFGFAHFASTPGGEEIVFNYFQTLWTSLGGLVMGYLLQASRSLVLPYVVHMYGNLIQYVL